MPERLLYTAEDAAKMLRVGRTRVYELIKSGQLESVKIAGSRRIPDECVRDYINKLRRQSEAA